VGDVVKAFNSAILSANSCCKVFNIGFGRGYSINELLDNIVSVLHIKPDVKYTAGRNMDVPANILDVSMAQRHIGWSAETSLAEGIEKTAEFIKKMHLANKG
jgi:UDP-glucose 4-epimerase